MPLESDLTTHKRQVEAQRGYEEPLWSPGPVRQPSVWLKMRQIKAYHPLSQSSTHCFSGNLGLLTFLSHALYNVLSLHLSYIFPIFSIMLFLSLSLSKALINTRIAKQSRIQRQSLQSLPIRQRKKKSRKRAGLKGTCQENNTLLSRNRVMTGLDGSLISWILI